MHIIEIDEDLLKLFGLQTDERITILMELKFQWNCDSRGITISGLGVPSVPKLSLSALTLTFIL